MPEKEEIKETRNQEMVVAQNPKLATFQLMKRFVGDTSPDSTMACYCPYAPPYMLNNKMTRFGCDTGCPHASAKLKEDGKVEYTITCGGPERSYECFVAGGETTKNQPSKLVGI